jgi:hypothetical protein
LAENPIDVNELFRSLLLVAPHGGHYRPGKHGLNDSVRLPPLPGKWLGTDCLLGPERCWLAVRRAMGGRIRTDLMVIGADGAVEAAGERFEVEDSWLAGLPGAVAAGASLLVPTDGGIVRLEVEGGRVREARRFPESAPFVDAATRLLLAGDVLHAVRGRAIERIEIA